MEIQNNRMSKSTILNNSSKNEDEIIIKIGKRTDKNKFRLIKAYLSKISNFEYIKNIIIIDNFMIANANKKIDINRFKNCDKFKIVIYIFDTNLNKNTSYIKVDSKEKYEEEILNNHILNKDKFACNIKLQYCLYKSFDLFYNQEEKIEMLSSNFFVEEIFNIINDNITKCNMNDIVKEKLTKNLIPSKFPNFDFYDLKDNLIKIVINNSFKIIREKIQELKEIKEIKSKLIEKEIELALEDFENDNNNCNEIISKQENDIKIGYTPEEVLGFRDKMCSQYFSQSEFLRETI